MDCKISLVFYLWQQGNISGAELAGLYILLHLEGSENRPWWSGVRKIKSKIVRVGAPLPWALLTLGPQIPGQLQEQIADPSLAELFEYSVIRAFPESALKALRNLLTQPLYQVHIFSEIPHPRVVLKLQTEGLRPLSLLRDPKDLVGPPKECHDLYTLAVHDLTHVEQFFGNPRQHQAQVGFFKLISRVYDGEFQKGLLQEAIQKKPLLRKDFFYLISDMNTHCVHLLKFLESALSRHQERELYDEVLRVWELPAEVLGIASCVNQPGLSGEDYLKLEEFFYSRP